MACAVGGHGPGIPEAGWGHVEPEEVCGWMEGEYVFGVPLKGR